VNVGQLAGSSHFASYVSLEVIVIPIGEPAD